MEKFTLEAGNKTPYINFQPDGNLELSGKSIPENSAEFYASEKSSMPTSRIHTTIVQWIITIS